MSRHNYNSSGNSLNIHCDPFESLQEIVNMSSDKWKKVITALNMSGDIKTGSPSPRTMTRLGSSSSIDKAMNKCRESFEAEQELW